MKKTLLALLVGALALPAGAVTVENVQGSQLLSADFTSQ